MPVYQGNLYDLLTRLTDSAGDLVPIMTKIMLFHISDALNFVHTRNPPIIHRDIKPPNILYWGNKFFLTDFGIAKFIDESNTIVGTQWYMAPEILAKRDHTPRVDIWGLGVTVLECSGGLPAEARRGETFSSKKQWHNFLYAQLN
jgi:serine/threonine protein kinase